MEPVKIKHFSIGSKVENSLLARFRTGRTSMNLKLVKKMTLLTCVMLRRSHQFTLWWTASFTLLIIRLCLNNISPNFLHWAKKQNMCYLSLNYKTIIQILLTLIGKFQLLSKLIFFKQNALCNKHINPPPFSPPPLTVYRLFVFVSELFVNICL